MRQRKIFGGFIPTTISELYKHAPDFFSGFGLLITCLDSDHAPSGMETWRKQLDAAGIGSYIIGTSVWIEASKVATLFREAKTFYGFDEVYLLTSRPDAKIIPRESFTADRLTFTKGVPEALASAMTRLNASAYLSDGTGIGLNFACDSKGAANKLSHLGGD